MPNRTHRYRVEVEWTGNSGEGTARYRGYERTHRLTGVGKPPIAGSSDPSFLGDPACWNPEELLIGSLAACHQLWYLGLCANEGIVVTAYRDEVEGEMAEESDGAGQFRSVTLRPRVTIGAGCDVDRAIALHERAHQMCFIARSVNFPVGCDPLVTIADATSA